MLGALAADAAERWQGEAEQRRIELTATLGGGRRRCAARAPTPSGRSTR